jgi:hypothetical protein
MLGDLIERLEKFNSDQMHSIQGTMAANARLNGRRFSGQSRKCGRRGRRWNRQVQKLIGANCSCAGKERPCSADIQRFREVKKFHSGGVRATDKHRYLDAYPLRTPALSGG